MLARDLNVTMPARINALIEIDQEVHHDLYSTLAPICRAATMAYTLDKRGDNIQDDAVCRFCY